MQQAVREKTRAYLQLVRFPNVFTAIADVLAGYFIAMAPKLVWSDLLGLAVSSSMFYAGGCALNDLCDLELDARERPFRPLPSGKVSPWEAGFLVIFLFVGGLSLAFGVGGEQFLLGAILVALIVSYDAFTKDKPIVGPLNMAACRSCNLLLGMSCGLSTIGTAALFPLFTLVYVFSLTILSRFEVHSSLGPRALLVAGGWLAVIGALLGLGIGGRMSTSGVISLGLLGLFTGPPLFAALYEPTPDRIGKAVKFLILGLPLLNAVYVSGMQGWPYGIVVAACLIPALLAARHLYVT